MKARVVVRSLLFTLLLATSAVAAEAPRAVAEPVDARAELTAWFGGLDQSSPLLGSINQSPELQQQIENRIATMDDAELESIRMAMAEVPDWQNAPQMLAEMLPEEMRGQLLQAGDYLVEKSDEALAARDDLSTLVALTRILPEDQIARLGIDASKLQQLDAAFQGMSPLEVTMLHNKLSATPEWGEGRKRALEALPDAVKKGSAALALHGELTETDVSSLDAFRTEVLELLERIDALPATLRSRLDAEKVRTLADRLSYAGPEMLFMVREQISADQIETIEMSVALLERIAGMTPEEYAELDRFREELRASIGDGTGATGRQLDQLAPEQLMLLQDSLGANPEWQNVMPVVADTFSDPATEAAILNAGSRRAELEQFRFNAIAFIESSIGQPGVGQQEAAASTQILQNASFEHLALIQAAHSRMPQDASAAAMVALPPVAANAVDLNCVVSLGSINLPLDIGNVSLGSINFNWICTPLENAINAVANTVDSLVSAITDTVDDIWTFIQGIPDLAVTALETFFNDLLDIEIANGVSLLDIASASNIGEAITQMVNLMGLNNFSWLNQLTAVLGPMPMLPCPAQGVSTPFGPVGDWDAYMNQQRYQFVIEEVLDIIPETEISLAVKIPAQVLFMGFKYLGVCMDYEQESATWDHYEAYWATAHTNQGTISSQVLTTSSNLSGQLASSTTSLTGTVDSESQIIQDKIDALQFEMGESFENQGGDIDNHFQEAWDLELRLAIEENLKSGEGNELAVFQMPAPHGYLEVVRDVLRSSIDGMIAIGERIGQAEKYFADGQSAMSDGEFKDAYKSFQKSYAALVK